MSEVAGVCHIDDLDDLCLEGILTNICEGSATMANARATCRRWRATIERIRAQKLREIGRTFEYLRANAQERLMFAIIRAKPDALREHLRTCGLNSATIGKIEYVNMLSVFMQSPVTCAAIEDSRANIGDPMILQVLREETGFDLLREIGKSPEEEFREWSEGIYHTLYFHTIALWPGVSFAQIMPDTMNHGTMISRERLRELFEECANICARIARRDDDTFSYVMAILEATLTWNRDHSLAKMRCDGLAIHNATCCSHYNYLIPTIIIACARYMTYNQFYLIWHLFRKYEKTAFNMAALEFDIYIGMIITSRGLALHSEGLMQLISNSHTFISGRLNEACRYLHSDSVTDPHSFAKSFAQNIVQIIRHSRIKLSALCEYIIPWYELEWAQYYDQLFIEIALHARLITQVPPMIDDETVLARSRDWANRYWYDTVFTKDGTIEPIEEIDRDIERIETYVRIDRLPGYAEQHMCAPSSERNFRIFRLILRLTSVERIEDS